MDTKNLDLNLLLALEALLDEQNVTRAAARLHISQPALSSRLARLRHLFGDELLLPAHRGMTPTAKARELRAPLCQSLHELRSIIDGHKKFEPQTDALTVSIAASDYVQHTALIPLVLGLRAMAPNVRVALRVIDGAALSRQMVKGDVDLAMMTPDPSQKELRTRKLFDETYLCIARKAHPRIRRQLTLKLFCELEHVVVSPRGGGFSGPTDDALAAQGLQRKVVLSAAHFLFVPEIVAKSDLIALVPARMAQGMTAVQVFAPPLAIRGFQVAMFWHDRTHSHPGYRWLRERLTAGYSDPFDESRKPLLE
jgi:DNA-binding transcriptional LysR family regulator